LLFLLAIIGALSSGETAGDRVVAVVFAFDRSLRLMEVGLFLLLILLCRIFKNYWRQPVYGIAVGFGVFASVELILVSFVMAFGESHATTISLLKSNAYNLVTLVWIGYLAQRPHLVPRVEPAPNPLGLTLATSPGVTDPDVSFISRVERTVDRVLSTSDWSKPTADGSRVVTRKPGPEKSK
jgi:hypothetical protein